MTTRALCASVQVLDAVQALAFVGDLSMGQPIDHSARTAWIASQLADLAEGEGADADDVACAALLRWSGCTANAPEFSDLLGDDVNGRRTMLSTVSARNAAAFAAKVSPLGEIHCEVSGDIARLLGMPPRVEQTLRQIFDRYDGFGQPEARRGSQVPHAVFLVSIAGDLEIFSRVHGLSDALRFIGDRANTRYPAFLVHAMSRHAADWLHALEQGAAADLAPLAGQKVRGTRVPLELVADVIDLKLPWTTGYSRRLADAAATCAASSREVEVLRHISLGASNKEAARTLGISPSTVRAHLENVFRKLGCSTRAAATLKAMTLGLL